MTEYRHEIRALIDPEQTEGMPDGGLLQHISVILTDDPPEDPGNRQWRAPAAITLRPRERASSRSSCSRSPSTRSEWGPGDDRQDARAAAAAR